MSAAPRPSTVGIIGGSGIYALEGLAEIRSVRVESGFGSPSDELVRGTIGSQELVFLPRHGSGHRMSPSEIDYRANIDALKRVGVTDVFSFSAVGSLNEALPPGTFVIVDQFVDRTFARKKSFFDRGIVAHVSMAHPTCARLGDALEAALKEAGVPYRRGGTLLVMEGPQFSTRAESEIYRRWGCDVIGMTAMPEAKLAREAELCYATLAMVTDFDCWHPDHDSVTVDHVMATMSQNVEAARKVLGAVLPKVSTHPARCPHGCDHALDAAIVTPREHRSQEAIERLSHVAGRVLGAGSPSAGGH